MIFSRTVIESRMFTLFSECIKYKKTAGLNLCTLIRFSLSEYNCTTVCIQEHSTERRGRVRYNNTPASYSGSPEFDSRP